MEGAKPILDMDDPDVSALVLTITFLASILGDPLPVGGISALVWRGSAMLAWDSGHPVVTLSVGVDNEDQSEIRHWCSDNDVECEMETI